MQAARLWGDGGMLSSSRKGMAVSAPANERRLGKTVVGALSLVLGLVCLTMLVVNLGRDLSIWVLGRRITAKVVDSRYEMVDVADGAEFTARYFITYEFTTPAGKIITGTSQLGGMEWSALGVGSPVDIAYFPLYPAHNRLDDTRFVLLLAITYVPIVFLTWAGLTLGCYLLRRPRKERVPFFREILEQGTAKDTAG
jgi:hypothetical protein